MKDLVFDAKLITVAQAQEIIINHLIFSLRECYGFILYVLYQKFVDVSLSLGWTKTFVPGRIDGGSLMKMNICGSPKSKPSIITALDLKKQKETRQVRFRI